MIPTVKKKFNIFMKKNLVLANIQVNLKKYMKIKGLTIKELGEKSGVSEPTIKRLRIDSAVSSNTSIDVLSSLANALDITVKELIEDPNSQQEPTNYSEQNNEINNQECFVYKFRQQVFVFQQNDKAIFKSFSETQDHLTQFFFDNHFNLYRLIQTKDDEIIAENKHGEISSFDYKDVMAIIYKQVYG